MTEPLNREYYRLLSDGEAIQSKDEYYDFVERGWTPVPPFPPYAKALPLTLFRRLIEPPKWISVNERAIEFPCWVHYGGTTVFHARDERMAREAGILRESTHWMPATPRPDPPKEKDWADEKAYTNYFSGKFRLGETLAIEDAVSVIRDTWFAALEYARKK